MAAEYYYKHKELEAYWALTNVLWPVVGCMAIQVVQGLIDTGRQLSQSSLRPAQQPNQVQQQNSPASNLANVAQTAQALATSASQIQQTFVSSEATLISVRSGRPGGDSDKVRDPERAQRLADTVADDIREGAELSDGAHRSLTATTAREHFA